MNKTKKNLIMAAAILELIAAFLLLIVFIFCLLAQAQLEAIITEIMDGGSFPIQYDLLKGLLIGALAFALLFYLIAPITLLCSIRKGGEKFATSKGLYITGVVFTILCGPISIPAILIYVALSKKE